MGPFFMVFFQCELEIFRLESKGKSSPLSCIFIAIPFSAFSVDKQRAKDEKTV
jgi:hypothetical protein